MSGYVHDFADEMQTRFLARFQYFRRQLARVHAAERDFGLFVADRAATSPVPPLPTNGSSVIAPAKSCCNLKSPYRDGTTHIVMSPLDCMQRLAALVPRPRLHLIRFHGVLASNAKSRPAIVPGPTDNTSEHAADHTHAQHASARLSWARLLKRVFDIEHCPQCGGRLKIIAAIEEPCVIVRILAHPGLPARAPPRAPARAVDPFQAA